MNFLNKTVVQPTVLFPPHLQILKEPVHNFYKNQYHARFGLLLFEKYYPV
jgi:hypothetical protein